MIAALLAALLAQTAPVVVHPSFALSSTQPAAPLSEWTAASGRETVWLDGDGVTLRGWRYAAPKSPAPVVLIFGGNGYSIASIDDRLRAFAAAGATIVEYDYRGFGFSTGSADVTAMRADALRLYDATVAANAGKPVVVMGYSMGSLFASYVAAQRAVRALILISPLESAAAETAYLLQPGSYTIAPDTATDFDVAGNVAKSHAPLLVIHGSADTLVPIAQGRADFAASPSTDKRFVEVAGAEHVGMLEHLDTLIALTRFFSSLQ